MHEGMLHIRGVEGPKKTGSVETRLEAMEQQVFMCQGMVEHGLNANHMMITEFTNKHMIDANDIGKHLCRLYDRIDQLQGQIYDLQNQNCSKTILIGSSLASIPMYMMGMYILPEGVHSSFDKDLARFFSQAEEKCCYLEWIDPEWSVAMQFCIGQLWSMHDKENEDRIRDNLKLGEFFFKIIEEKRRMEEQLRFFKLDFAKRVADKEEAISQLGSARLAISDLKEEIKKKKLAGHSSTNLHQVLRAKAEKERD
ncbi:40S ribosomal protein S5-1 [Hordeum vulgare]|nr:40S ribosomal protein S5-1 [Hordeum vulgare]